MRILSANRILMAAGLVLALTREGHVGVTTLKKMDLGELAGTANIILVASPLKPFEQKESISYSDSSNRIPPLQGKAYRFKRGEVLKNNASMELPDTLIVFDYDMDAESRGHVLAHTAGEVESPVTRYYESPIKESKLAKEKSVVLFLTEVNDNPIATPRNWLKFTANHSYEKTSKLKAVTKLVAEPVFPPRPKGMKAPPPFPPRPKPPQ
jgi:hypothetical protein